MKVNRLIWALLAVSLVGTIFIYPELPQEIPIHWNTVGEVDGWGGKGFAFLTATLPLVMALLFIILPKIDPKRDSYKKHQKAYSVFINFLLVFFVFIHWLSMLAALGYEVNIGIFVSGAVGVLFVVLGNYMGQIRHNYFFGIRTPWTLASEKVWSKTHRIASWFFIIAGLLFFASIFNPKIGFWVALIWLLGSVCYLTAYSYFEFKRLKKNNSL